MHDQSCESTLIQNITMQSSKKIVKITDYDYSGILMSETVNTFHY